MALIAMFWVICAARASALAGPSSLHFTGGEQSYVVPGDVTVLAIELQGGGSPNAARGGVLKGFLAVRSGQVLFAEVGQKGSRGGGATFGGGGAAGAPPPVLCTHADGTVCSTALASSGGGASDVRTCPEKAASCPGGGSSDASRLLVGAGAGGAGGVGNSSATACAVQRLGGAGANPQPLPGGDPGIGAVPIRVAAGLVIPGYASGGDHSVMTIDGTVDAGFGGAAPGAGGSMSGCSAADGATMSQSVPGAAGSGPGGGPGGDAGGLAACAPPTCGTRRNQAYDAGAGGGGGGGYLGGGGGATGLDSCQNPSTGQACTDRSAGQGGAAGSSFVSNQIMYPSAPAPQRSSFVRMVPAVEIIRPAENGIYRAGQRVDASWSCAASDRILGSLLDGCVGTVASGQPIDTSPGRHVFLIRAPVAGGAGKVVATAVAYTVLPGARQQQRDAHGFGFTLTVPGTCLARGSRLPATVTATGGSASWRIGRYDVFVGRGRELHRRVVVHRRHRTVVSFGPTITVFHAGAYALPIGGLRSGAHTLRLVVVLRRRPAARPHRHLRKHAARPTATQLTLMLPFAIC